MAWAKLESRKNFKKDPWFINNILSFEGISTVQNILQIQGNSSKNANQWPVL